MSAPDNTPKNFNYLSPLNFHFAIKRAPTVNFFVQKTVLPGLFVEPLSAPNPMLRIPLSGDHINYENYTFTFKVDEDMANWLEIYNWLTQDGKLSYALYKKAADQPSYSGNSIKSDITLTTLSGTKMPNMQIVFHDAFPVALSGFQFVTTGDTVDYVEASAAFKYTWYEISKLVVT